MPTLAQEATLALPMTITSITFKPDAWMCTVGKFGDMQIRDGRYRYRPLDLKMVGNTGPQFCRQPDPKIDYTAEMAATSDREGCPDRSCVAVSIDHTERGTDYKSYTYRMILYAPNSFVASSH